MSSLFIGIIGAWAFGMVVYIATCKADRYNNIKYTDVSDKIRKYKRSDEKVNINKKK